MATNSEELRKQALPVDRAGQSTVQFVRVVDVDISFGSLLMLFIKAAFAIIPAAIVVTVIWTLVSSVVLGLLRLDTTDLALRLPTDAGGMPATPQAERDSARSIDDVLADGFYGVKWGATIAEAQAVIRGGIPEDGGQRLWFYNGQPFFGGSRGDRDRIEMFFATSGLWRIRIEYPSCIEIDNALRSTFGEPSGPGASAWNGEDFGLYTLPNDGCDLWIARR